MNPATEPEAVSAAAAAAAVRSFAPSIPKLIRDRAALLPVPLPLGAALAARGGGG